MSAKIYSTLSLSQSAAMFAGGLLRDFSMTRFGTDWVILLYLVGGDVSAIHSDDPAVPGIKIFKSADEAMHAVSTIGFSTEDVGIWRPDAERKMSLERGRLAFWETQMNRRHSLR